MNHTPLPNQVDEILQALIQTLPIKATEIGWEKIGEDVADTVQALTDLLADSEIKGRLKELEKVWSGMNTAGGIRDGGYSARNLNLDDLSYYLYNRRRVLKGQKALTPEEWFEAER